MKLIIHWSGILDGLSRPKSKFELESWLQKFQKYSEPYNIFEKMIKSDPVYAKCKKIEYGHNNKECFQYLLNKTKHTVGLRFFFNPILETDEEKEVKAYIMESNREFPYSYECNKNFTGSDGFYIETSDKYPIKMINDIRLKSFRTIHAKRIYRSLNGFLVSSQLGSELKSMFSGIELLEIKNCSGKKIHDNLKYVVSTSILPPSERNILRYEQEGEDPKYKALGYNGTLIYNKDSFKKMKDCNYTCEAIHSDSKPEFIVSRKYKQFCEEEQISGVMFRPVFEKGSRLYSEFSKLVREFCAELSMCNEKHVVGKSSVNPLDILNSEL